MNGSTDIHPSKRPPLKMDPILRALADAGVRWVMTGSVVLVAYGARFIPNDLDIVPQSQPDNLERLATLLGTMGAKPAHFPNWAGSASLEQCLAWQPSLHSEDFLTRLFITEFGPLDIIPRQVGTYDQLAADATPIQAFGIPLLLAQPVRIIQEVLSRGKSKDRPRRAELVTLARELQTGTPPGPKALAKALEARYS